MDNKTKHLDGLPGVILQGIKGNDGIRGNRVFHSYHNSVIDSYQEATSTHFKYPVYDIWIKDEIKGAPSISNNKNYYLNDTPLKNDHIIYTHSESIYLYEVLEYATNDASFDSSILSKFDMDKITSYYTGLGYWNDVCIVKYLDVYTQNEINVSVVATNKPVTFKAWDGAINDKTKNAISYNDSTEMLSFDILSNNEQQLGNIKIVAEFIPSEYSGLMSSTMPQVWNIEPEYKTSSVPSDGYYIKYTQDFNFDNENLRNFSITIKDWNDGATETSYSSNVLINKNSINEYTILLFAYTNNGLYKSKNYIGEIDFTSF